jgi:hypothetical protein
MIRLPACGLVLVMAGGLHACCFRSCDPGAAGDAMATADAVPVGALEITDWGPRQARAGVAFNVQPGGHAALWIRVDRPLDGESVLVRFGDAYLEGEVAGVLVTAMVPPESYARPGSYDVRVVARGRDGRRDSNKVVFTVH